MEGRCSASAHAALPARDGADEPREGGGGGVAGTGWPLQKRGLRGFLSVAGAYVMRYKNSCSVVP